MASIVETKAVALRRGNHSENLAFTGVQGETVVDLGYEDLNGNLGVDSNTTLRLHNGVTKGGIPMARADLLNVSSELLAENRQLINDQNLAYADLSNIEHTNVSSAINKIKTTMTDYGLADEESVQTRLNGKVNLNTNNLNTSYLVSSEIHNGIEEGNKPLAYADTSNINTADLVNSSYHHDEQGGNKPLAYADTSNVNTADFTNPAVHDGQISGNAPLGYADGSNFNTTNMTLAEDVRPDRMSGPSLARADLGNVSSTIIDNIIDEIVDVDTIERISNKDSVINENSPTNLHYPETKAVIDYVSSKTSDNANTSLTNVVDWENLYRISDNGLVKRNVETVTSQNGFKSQKEYNTGIYLIDDPQDFLSVEILEVDASGSIVDLDLTGLLGSLDLTAYNPFTIVSETNVNATLNITSTSNGDGTYSYQVQSISSSGSGFEIEKEYVLKSTISNEYYKVIYKELQIIPITLKDETDGTGKIEKAVCSPEYGITNINNPSVTLTSETNTTATVSITSSLYTTAPGAGVAKRDLTNLLGMTATDQVIEDNSPWRIRHDESIPSTNASTIPNEQNYTIATNGNVWRALKALQFISNDIPSVMFKAQFIQNNDYSTQCDVVVYDSTYSNCVLNHYAKSDTNKFTTYILLPNHQYSFQIKGRNNTGLQADDYDFTTGDYGSSKIIEYSFGEITFNLNVQTAQISFKHPNEPIYFSGNITNGTYTRMITNETIWTITKEGYSSQSGSIEAINGNQTINVTLEENQ